MGEIRLERDSQGDYLEEKVVIANIPDLGDKTGEQFLDHLQTAITRCRELIGRGYRLVSFWSDPDEGIEFTLKKKRG